MEWCNLLIIFVSTFSSGCYTFSDEIPFKAYLRGFTEINCSLESLYISTREVNYTLNLLNVKRDILLDNTTLILGNGSQQILDTTPYCLYQSGNALFRVEIMTQNRKLSGVIVKENETFIVKPQTLVSEKTLALEKYRSNRKSGRCGIVHDPFSTQEPKTSAHSKANLKRDKRRASYFISNWKEEILSIELYIVVDYNLYNKLKSIPATTSYVIEIVNHVNAYYRQFSLHVVLIGLEIWTNMQKVNLTSDSDLALKKFSYYRRTKVTLKHDTAHLLTSILFDNHYAGKAYINGMCQFSISTGVTTNYYSNSALEAATTLAHELGHNLGLEHDTSACSCAPDKTCLMAASSGIFHPMKWSDCSISELKSKLQTGLSTCLRDDPQFVQSQSSHPFSACGNGVVDTGEECDPGERTTSSKCCNPTTCKLQPGAECATGACCDTSQCSLRERGTLCSSSSTFDPDCDFPEYCDGASEFCPPDTYPADGTKECGQDKGNYCYKKQCGSRKGMCQIIFGPDTVESTDICFQQNAVNKDVFTQGNYGYCNYTIAAQTEDAIVYNYLPCSPSNYLCGSLHCTHLNNADINQSTIPWPSLNYFILSAPTFKCYHPRIDFHLAQVRDPGLAPNGATCGDNKVCLDSECVSLSKIQTVECSCSNGGRCNNFGNCHCPGGYAGPTCETLCPDCCGGSEKANYCRVNVTIVHSDTTTTTIKPKETVEPTNSSFLIIIIAVVVGLVVIILVVTGIAIYLARSKQSSKATTKIATTASNNIRRISKDLLARPHIYTVAGKLPPGGDNYCYENSSYSASNTNLATAPPAFPNFYSSSNNRANTPLPPLPAD